MTLGVQDKRSRAVVITGEAELWSSQGDVVLPGQPVAPALFLWLFLVALLCAAHQLVPAYQSLPAPLQLLFSC